MKKNSYTIVSTVVFLVCFLVIFVETLLGGSGINIILNEKLTALHTPVLISFMITITNIFQPTILAILSIIVSIVFVHKKRFDLASIFLGTMFAGIILGSAIKSLAHITRPAGASLVAFSGASFPSGHMLAGTVFFTILFYCLFGFFKTKSSKVAFGVISFVIVFTIGFSRLYLGVHWLSDVLGGLFLGLFISSLSIFLYNVLYKNRLAQKI